MMVRYTKSVHRGLESIHAYMSNEYDIRQDSGIECRTIDEDGHSTDCGKCEGCVAYDELGKALSWLAHQMKKHNRFDLPPFPP
jgi:hypothetical protein